MAVNRKRARRRLTAEHAGPKLSHPIRINIGSPARQRLLEGDGRASSFITVDEGLTLMGELATAILADLRASASTDPETPPAGDA